jgi:hypothetical protein
MRRRGTGNGEQGTAGGWLILWMRGLVLFLFVFACAKNPTPEAALTSYVEAVQKRDAKATYQLLSKEMQAQFGSEEKFTEFFYKYYEEIAQESAQLSANKKKLQIEATLPLEDGSQIFLRETPQGWQVIETEPLAQATTVAEALTGIAQMARQEALRGPLDFYLSAEARAERAVRLQAFAELVSLVGPYDISINDKHATARLKDGRILRFYQERGHWCLVSLPEEFLF